MVSGTTDPKRQAIRISAENIFNYKHALENPTDLNYAAQVLHRRAQLKLNAQEKLNLIKLFKNNLSHINQPYTAEEGALEVLQGKTLGMSWRSLAKEDIGLAILLLSDDVILDVILKSQGGVERIMDVLSTHRQNLTDEFVREVVSKSPKLFNAYDIADSSSKPTATPSQPSQTTKSTTLSMDDILKNHREEFREFLRKELNDENLEFLDACDEYDKLLNTSDKLKKWQEIYNKFIEAGSPREINIESGLRSSIARDRVDEGKLTQVRASIKTLLELDPYKRFLAASSKQAVVKEKKELELSSELTAKWNEIIKMIKQHRAGRSLSNFVKLLEEFLPILKKAIESTKKDAGQEDIMNVIARLAEGKAVTLSDTLAKDFEEVIVGLSELAPQKMIYGTLAQIAQEVVVNAIKLSGKKDFNKIQGEVYNDMDNKQYNKIFKNFSIEDIVDYIIKNPNKAYDFLKVNKIVNLPTAGKLGRELGKFIRKQTGKRNFRQELGERPDLLEKLLAAAENSPELRQAIYSTQLMATSHFKPTQTATLLDVDQTLIFPPRGDSEKNIYNSNLITSLVSSKIKSNFIFTDMSEFKKTGAGSVEERVELVNHLKSKGLNVDGVITPQDYVWHIPFEEMKEFKKAVEIEYQKQGGKGKYTAAFFLTVFNNNKGKFPHIEKLRENDFSGQVKPGTAFREASQNHTPELQEKSNIGRIILDAIRGDTAPKALMAAQFSRTKSGWVGDVIAFDDKDHELQGIQSQIGSTGSTVHVTSLEQNDFDQKIKEHQQKVQSHPSKFQQERNTAVEINNLGKLKTQEIADYALANPHLAHKVFAVYGSRLLQDQNAINNLIEKGNHKILDALENSGLATAEQLKEARKRPLKIALVDIDGTLLIEQNGEKFFNTALIEQLKQFDEVYLFTQRGMIVSNVKLRQGDSDHTVAYVVEELKRQGLNVKVSTSLEKFHDNDEPGKYYDEKVSVFESRKVNGNSDKSSIDEEISLILNNNEIYTRFCEYLHNDITWQTIDSIAVVINDNISDHGWGGLTSFKNLGEKPVKNAAVEALKGYFDPKNKSVDEETKKKVLRVLLHKGYAIGPLQSKVDQYDHVSKKLAEQYKGRKVDFVVIDDQPENLGELKKVNYGDKQPVLVSAVEKSNVLSSESYAQAFSKGFATPVEQRRTSDAKPLVEKKESPYGKIPAPVRVADPKKEETYQEIPKSVLSQEDQDLEDEIKKAEKYLAEQNEGTVFLESFIKNIENNEFKEILLKQIRNITEFEPLPKKEEMENFVKDINNELTGSMQAAEYTKIALKHCSMSGNNIFSRFTIAREKFPENGFKKDAAELSIVVEQEKKPTQQNDLTVNHVLKK